MLKLLICVVWASTLSTYLRAVFNRLPLFKDNIDESIAAFFITSIALALPSLINKYSFTDYLFYLANVLFLLSGYIFFPENTGYLNDEAPLCIFTVFTYYFIGRVLDIENHFNLLLLLSAVCIVMNVFYYAVYAQANRNMAEIAGEDNMYAAYQLLPHVAFLLWATLKKFAIWKIAVTFLGIMFLLSCGTRGPLACIAFFGIVYFFFYMNFRGAIYVKTIIIAIGGIIIVNLQGIVIYLIKLFTGLQLSTRILEKFITGDIGNDSYRSVLRDKLYDVLNSGDHFFGLGAFGCRNYDIIYPHYLPLDLACTYGYLIGYLLLVALAVLIISAFWFSKGKLSQEFLLFLFAISIIKLMLSNSFLLEPFFYLFIGVCIKEVFYRKLTNTAEIA